PLFPQTVDFLGRHEDVHAVVLPRTDEQRAFVESLALPSIILPERAVDAQSLFALADLVVSAGGTMIREAAALGVPVYTTYGGRLGGVDEELIREGRLVPLSDPRALKLEKRHDASAVRVRRDPERGRPAYAVCGRRSRPASSCGTPRTRGRRPASRARAAISSAPRTPGRPDRPLAAAALRASRRARPGTGSASAST